MARKYDIIEREGFDSYDDTRTRVFEVLGPPNRFGYREPIGVWAGHGMVGCTACSGPLVSMSQTCRHARAVKRYLAREAAEEGGEG